MSRPTLSEAEDVSIHMRAKPPDITQEGQEPSYAGHSHASASTPKRDTDLNDWDKQFATFYDHKVHVATKGTMEVLVNHLTFNLGFLYHLPFINEYRRSGVLLAEALEELYQVSKLPIDEQVDLLDGPIDPRPLKENFIRLTALKSLLSPYEDPDGELQFKNEEGKVLLDVNNIPTASLDRIVARVWRNHNIVKEIFTALEAKYEENFSGVKKLAPARAFICLPDPLTTPARNRDSPATFLTPKPDIREQLSSIDQSSISNVRTPSPPSANIGEEKRKVAPSTIKTGKPESVSFQPTIASLEPHVPPVGHTTDVKQMSQPRDSVVEPRTPSNITGERTSFRNNPREHQDLSTHPFFRNSPAARSVTQDDFHPNPIDDKEEEEDPDPEHFYDSLATLNQGRSTVTTIPKEYRLVKRTTTLPTSYKYTSNSEFSAFRKRFDLWCSTNNVGYLVDPLFHSVYDLHGYDAIKHYIDPKTKEKSKFNPAQFPHDLSTLHTWLMDALVNTEVSHFAYDNSDGITIYRNLIADCDSEANRRTRANSWKTRLYRPYHANTDLVTFISTFREDVNKYNLEVLRPQDAIDDTAQRRLLINKLIGCDDQAISTLAQIADSNNNYESMTQLCTFLTSKARQMDDRAKIYSRNRAAKRHVNVARAESPIESTTNPDDEQMDVQLFAQVLNAMQHDAFDLTENQHNKLPSEVKKIFRQARYYVRKYHKEKKNQRQNAIKNDGQQGLPGQYSKPKTDANIRPQENPPPHKVNLARQPDEADDASMNTLSTDGFFNNLDDTEEEDVKVLLAAAPQEDFICNLIHCDETIDPSVFDPLEPDPNVSTIHSNFLTFVASQFRGGYKNTAAKFFLDTAVKFFLDKLALQQNPMKKALNTNSRDGYDIALQLAYCTMKVVHSYFVSSQAMRQMHQVPGIYPNVMNIPTRLILQITNLQDYLGGAGFKLQPKRRLDNLVLSCPHFGRTTMLLIRTLLQQSNQLATSAFCLQMMNAHGHLFPHLNGKVVVTNTFFAQTTYYGCEQWRIGLGKQACRDFTSEANVSSERIQLRLSSSETLFRNQQPAMGILTILGHPANALFHQAGVPPRKVATSFTQEVARAQAVAPTQKVHPIPEAALTREFAPISVVMEVPAQPTPPAPNIVLQVTNERSDRGANLTAPSRHDEHKTNDGMEFKNYLTILQEQHEDNYNSLPVQTLIEVPAPDPDPPPQANSRDNQSTSTSTKGYTQLRLSRIRRTPCKETTREIPRYHPKQLPSPNCGQSVCKATQASGTRTLQAPLTEILWRNGGMAFGMAENIIMNSRVLHPW